LAPRFGALFSVGDNRQHEERERKGNKFHGCHYDAKPSHSLRDLLYCSIDEIAMAFVGWKSISTWGIQDVCRYRGHFPPGILVRVQKCRSEILISIRLTKLAKLFYA
jgi:hypothetical protein